VSVSDRLMQLGSWDVQLHAVPREVAARLREWGHIVILDTPMDPRVYGDELLGVARYVGVHRGDAPAGDEFTLSGVGLDVWLGDEDGKGDVYEQARVFNNASFIDTIRGLLPADQSVIEGTLHPVAGTYSGRHRFQDPRSAIGYVCELFDAEYRVTNTWKLDAGKADQLYPTQPAAVIVRRDAGADMDLVAVPGDVDAERDWADWTSRTVLLAEGEGEAIVTATADNTHNPYLNPRGLPVKRTRVVSESDTVEGNAQARAQLAQNRFSGARQALKLSADTHDFEAVGDRTIVTGGWVWVYDPDAGLVDPANEVPFRGRLLNPVKLRVVATTYPITDRMGVAFRTHDGDWFDLTDHLLPETGSVEVEAGGSWLKAIRDSEPVSVRVNAPTPDTDPGRTPAAPVISNQAQSGTYTDQAGNTRAFITISWTRPNNTDGTVVQDGLMFHVRWRHISNPTGWQHTTVGWADLEATAYELAPDGEYVFQVAAANRWGRRGAWSGAVAITAQPDTSPPSTPAAPEVTALPLQLLVTHRLGKATGGTYNLESDLDALEIHTGATAAFQPTAATMRRRVPANRGNLAAQVPVVAAVDAPDVTTRHVKVVAVDRAGNRSQPSAATAGQSVLIDSPELANQAVIAAKIADGAVTYRQLMVGSYDNLILNPGGESGLFAPWSLVFGSDAEATTVNPRSGSRSLRFKPIAGGIGRIDANGPLQWETQVAAQQGDRHYAEVWVCADQATNRRARLAIRYRTRANGGTTGGAASAWLPLTTAYQRLSVMSAAGGAAANAAWVGFEVEVETGPDTPFIHVEDAYARLLVEGVIIADGAVSAAKVAAKTLTADQMATNGITAESGVIAGLFVDRLHGGSLQVGHYITSSNYVPGVAGWRVDGDGFLEMSSGTFRGLLEAAQMTGGTINGATVTGGLLRTAASGSRMELLQEGGIGIIRWFNPSNAEVARLYGAGSVTQLRTSTLFEVRDMAGTGFAPAWLGALTAHGTVNIRSDTMLSLQNAANTHTGSLVALGSQLAVRSASFLSLQSDSEVRVNPVGTTTGAYANARAAAWLTGSDAKLKTDIQPLAGDTRAIVGQIARAAARYRRRSATDEPRHPLQAGLIANDLPDVVRADDSDGAAGYDLNAVAAVTAVETARLAELTEWLAAHAVLKPGAPNRPVRA